MCIGVVDGDNAKVANQTMREDFFDKRLKSQIPGTNELVDGVLIFDVPTIRHSQPFRLDVELLDKDTGPQSAQLALP